MTRFIQSGIYQPIETFFSPTEEKKSAISFFEFIELLRNEEDFYVNQQNDTKTILSHLRKIFYDIYGWNTQLIRGAKDVSNRYEVTLVSDEQATYPHKLHALVNRSGSKMESNFIRRQVVVKPGDWMNSNVGTVPVIYSNDNQENVLPDGLYCDLGHVLAGMDASNYPAVVAPLPSKLMSLSFLVPHVSNNAFCATWIGDLSSTAGEFLFQYLRDKKPLSELEKQNIVDAFSPGTDMLGNIDSIVIPSLYELNTHDGQRISDILLKYYKNEGNSKSSVYKRYSIFCKLIGLKLSENKGFENKKKWLRKYKKQLRNTTAFYVFTRSKKIRSYLLAFLVWVRYYDKRLCLDEILIAFLEALQNGIQNQIQTNTKSKDE